jgi:Putative transposase
VTLVLHTWGSALTHHPHVHCIVPGGGLALDEDRWVPCRQGFFLPVRVLSRYFRRRFLEELQQLHRRGELRFFGEHAALAEPARFAEYLAPLREVEWVVYAKRPFAGPEAVLAYLSRYTPRVAISNRRLIAFDQRGVTLGLACLVLSSVWLPRRPPASEASRSPSANSVVHATRSAASKSGSGPATAATSPILETSYGSQATIKTFSALTRLAELSCPTDRSSAA